MNEDVPRCDEWTEHDFKSMYGGDDPKPTPVVDGEVKDQFGIGFVGGDQSLQCIPVLIHLATGLAVEKSAAASRADLKGLADRLSEMPDTPDVDRIEADAEKWSAIIEEWLDEVTP